MSANQTIPIDFPMEAYESQLQAWIHEGYSESDIISQASHTWPMLPIGYTLATLRHLRKTYNQGQRKPVSPAQYLARIQNMRARHIKQIEQRLLEADAPVSLHSLYRGLLRDQEATCYKMMQAEQKPARRYSAAMLVQKEKCLADQLNQEEARLLKDVHTSSASSHPTRQSAGTMSNFGWMIGLVVSFLLSGCSISTARTSRWFSYTVSTPVCQPLVQVATMMQGSTHVFRQRTTQLHPLPAEAHQTLLQRAAQHPA